MVLNDKLEGYEIETKEEINIVNKIKKYLNFYAVSFSYFILGMPLSIATKINNFFKKEKKDAVNQFISFFPSFSERITNYKTNILKKSNYTK